MKPDVVLVNPRITDIPFHPLGLLHIAAMLEKSGYTVKVYDTFPGDDAFIEDIVCDRPKMVGITSATAQINRGLKIAEEIKRKASDIKIVFGGVHPTVMPQWVLEKPSVDFVVIGEGEITAIELFEKIRSGKDDYDSVKGIGYKADGRCVFTKPREYVKDLDSLPFPARHLLPSDWYFQPPGKIRGVWLERSATIMASRGCPGHCIFCSSHLMWGRATRFRSPQNVIAEIKQLVSDYGVNGLWFLDDTFTVNHQWVREFCSLLKQSGLKITWGVQARVNYVTEDLLREMKSAGCVQVDYGVESGSPKVLQTMKKEITSEQVKKAFDISRKVGIRSLATFMIGLPTEEKEDVEMTAKLVNEIKPDFAEFFFATPYPGTELFDMVKTHNWVNPSYDLSSWVFDKITDKPVMTISFSEQELIKMRSALYNQVFLRNYLFYLKRPMFLLKSSMILLKGWPAIGSGLSRVMKTKKLDSLFIDMLAYARKSAKKD
jgi:radical SAM superfamily enzyme YgiQ (UPF0313 family)